MSKLYNSQETVASKIKEFLLKVMPDIKKTQLKIIPYIIIGIIISESSVAHDIAKDLKGQFEEVQQESVVKRIKRFFINKLFDGYKFYDNVIKHVISNYKTKHKDKRVHIVFDHMFSHENFTVFMISLRIGTTGIPLWFRCFKGTPTDAFTIELLKDGISYVSELFGSDYEQIYLADRWFGCVELLKHIDNLGHTFCIRLKKNVKVQYYDKNWKLIITTAGKLQGQKKKSTKYKNVMITANNFKTNIVISKSEGVKESWIIVTNKDVKNATKNYKKRFGGIETIFKNQKSNGFYMEATVNASEKYFSSMYTMVCFATLFLVLIGTDYAKNPKDFNGKIQTHKIVKGIKRRVKSLFNTGLNLFHMAFNSHTKIRLPMHFILYDV